MIKRQLDDLMILINSLTNSQHILIGFRLNILVSSTENRSFPMGYLGKQPFPIGCIIMGMKTSKKKRQSATLLWYSSNSAAQFNSTGGYDNLHLTISVNANLLVTNPYHCWMYSPTHDMSISTQLPAVRTSTRPLT